MRGIWSNCCHHEHLVVTGFLPFLVQEVLRGPLPLGRDKQHYTQPTLFECWNHPGVSHDHLTFLVRAFICQRTSICISFFLYMNLPQIFYHSAHAGRDATLSRHLCTFMWVILLWTNAFPFLLILLPPPLVVWENIRTVFPLWVYDLYFKVQTSEK